MNILSFARRIAAAGVLLGLSTPASAPAAVVTCSPTQMKILASDEDQSGTSTSTSFQNIYQGYVSFTQGGAGASCVLVRFSATTIGVTGEAVQIRAFLDGLTPAFPAEMTYSYSNAGTVFGPHSFDFIFPSVAPGSHFVRMQFRSAGGGQVQVLSHSMVVHYAR